jgi:hypothetical protein
VLAPVVRSVNRSRSAASVHDRTDELAATIFDEMPCSRQVLQNGSALGLGKQPSAPDLRLCQPQTGHFTELGVDHRAEFLNEGNELNDRGHEFSLNA